MLLNATLLEDLPLATGTLGIIGILALTGHIIADIVYMYLDPRIRLPIRSWQWQTSSPLRRVPSEPGSGTDTRGTALEDPPPADSALDRPQLAAVSSPTRSALSVLA